MQALAAAGLQECRQPEFGQKGPYQLRRLLDLCPAHPLAGVQVERHAIRFADRALDCVPGMELDHVHLGC